MVCYRSFVSTPIWDVDRFVGFPLMLWGFAGFSRFEINGTKPWIILFLLLGFISTITGTIFFKQTLTDCIIANLNFFMIIIVLPFGYLLEKLQFTGKRFERLLLTLCWTNLIIKVLLFANKATYSYTSFFTSNDKMLDPRSFPFTLIITGLFIYFLKFIDTANPRYLLLSLVFLIVPNIFEFQRLDFLFVVIVLGIILVQQFKENAAPVFNFALLSFFMIVFTALYFYQELVPYISYFDQAVLFFTDPNQVEDSSAIARLMQLDYFYNNIHKDPLFGLGMIRPGFKGDIFQGDQEFNLADMGVLGIVMTHGIVGIIVFVYQIKFVLQYYKKIKNGSMIVNALYYYLLYLTLWSLGSSYIFQYSYHFLIILVLINYFHKLDMQDDAEINEQLEIS